MVYTYVEYVHTYVNVRKSSEYEKPTSQYSSGTCLHKLTFEQTYWEWKKKNWRTDGLLKKTNMHAGVGLLQQAYLVSKDLGGLETNEINDGLDLVFPIISILCY